MEEERHRLVVELALEEVTVIADVAPLARDRYALQQQGQTVTGGGRLQKGKRIALDVEHVNIIILEHAH